MRPRTLLSNQTLGLLGCAASFHLADIAAINSLADFSDASCDRHSQILRHSRATLFLINDEPRCEHRIERSNDPNHFKPTHVRSRSSSWRPPSFWVTTTDCFGFLFALSPVFQFSAVDSRRRIHHTSNRWTKPTNKPVRTRKYLKRLSTTDLSSHDDLVG